MKKIYVDKHTEEEARLYGELVLKNMGVKKSDSRYNELLDNFVKSALYQSVTKSMLPHEELGKNPTTPRTSLNTFEAVSFLGKAGVFSSMKDGENKKRLFRSAISTMSNIVLEGVYNKRVKREANVPSDKEFLPDGQNRLQSIKTQYLNNVIVTAIAAQLEPLLMSQIINLDALLMKIFGEETMKLNEAELTNKLHSEEFRVFFVKEIYNLIRRGQGFEDRTGTRSNPTKKSEKTYKVACQVGAARGNGLGGYYVLINLLKDNGKIAARDVVQLHRDDIYRFPKGTVCYAIYKGKIDDSDFVRLEE